LQAAEQNRASDRDGLKVRLQPAQIATAILPSSAAPLWNTGPPICVRSNLNHAMFSVPDPPNHFARPADTMSLQWRRKGRA
jgi:hypothetical protein